MYVNISGNYLINMYVTNVGKIFDVVSTFELLFLQFITSGPIIISYFMEFLCVTCFVVFGI
jgi:hypothetical protein